MKHLRPSFFIIGERKCGTSSLYRYLVAHPQVLPCKVKEPDLFSKPWYKIALGFRNYKKLFPAVDESGNIEFIWPELDEKGQLFNETITVERQEGVNYITGEASVNTFYYANPRILNRLLPGIKIILMLREPAERAFSHYRMHERFRKEGRKSMAKTDFVTDIRLEMKKVQQGEDSLFLGPSIYMKKLPKWLNIFGRDRLFVIRSEDLQQPEKAVGIMEQLFDYLQITEFDLREMLNQRFNVAPPKQMPEDIREELQAFFAPYNQQLNEFLGLHLY
ncbi:MAG: hypothetical protein DWQ02_18430 [Bacteroidetes bacterium]|nr:MAG: hypothetical protein DWQ02_18430 [Bacteroidota bacterium]